jgi:tagatose-1,6-bisphosphate aldolase
VATLSLGKYRGLQQCATPRGALSVLALDHRNNLRAALRPDAPDSVVAGEMTAFKYEAVKALASAASAILLDPEVGAAQCIASSALPGNVGLVVALEATGYTGDTAARQSRILPGWSVAKAKRFGANAVKLLVYYRPDAPTAAEIELLVRQVAADCAAHDLAFFLEPLSYSLEPIRKRLVLAERRWAVIETARRLVVPGVDVLKAEFPFDIASDGDEREWDKACAELTAASAVPWVLLSGAAGYEMYLRQVTVACRAGASGVAVGRAVWQEAPVLRGEARAAFLRSLARERMARVTALCDALARPWTDYYSAPDVHPDWYEHY